MSKVLRSTLPLRLKTRLARFARFSRALFLLGTSLALTAHCSVAAVSGAFEIPARKPRFTLGQDLKVKPPRISPREPPLLVAFPGSAYTAGLSTGKAIVGIMLDDTGKPIDSLIIASTADFFGRALLRQTLQLSYLPLSIDGLAVPSRYQVGYRFVADMPVFLNGNQALASWRLNSSEPDFVDRAHPESELDQKLEFTQAALPRLPNNYSAKDPSSVVVTISFYVDEAGHLRLPNVESTPAGELVRNAIKAASLWRFAPPRIQGQPVLAFAAREITFTERAR